MFLVGAASLGTLALVAACVAAGGLLRRAASVLEAARAAGVARSTSPP